MFKESFGGTPRTVQGRSTRSVSPCLLYQALKRGVQASFEPGDCSLRKVEVVLPLNKDYLNDLGLAPCCVESEVVDYCKLREIC